MTVMAKPMAAEDGAPTTTQVRNVAGICRALDMLIEWKLEQLAAEQTMAAQVEEAQVEEVAR